MASMDPNPGYSDVMILLLKVLLAIGTGFVLLAL